MYYKLPKMKGESSLIHKTISLTHSHNQTAKNHIPISQAGKPHSIPALNPTPQPLPPETTNAILLAPLLHHPSLDLVPHNFLFIDLRRRIFLLTPSSLDFGFEPLELRPNTLGVKPSGEIFQNNRVVEQDLLVPGRRGCEIGVSAGWRGGGD